MKLAFRSDGLAVEGSPPLELVDAVLRGVGQVMFQDNAYAGALFVAGAFAASFTAGAAVLVGAFASTLAAVLLEAERAQIRAGLFGFNGALVGIALAVFFRLDAVAWGSLVVGAAASSVVAAALARLLRTWNTPALTAPFVVVTWGFVAARATLSGLHPTAALAPARLAGAAAPQGDVVAVTLGEGLVRGVAEVFLQDGLASGGLFLLGLLVASRRACAAALIGSGVGLLAGWALGAPEASLRGGLYGFNGALTALALATFLARGAAAAGYTLLAVVVSTVVTAALSAALEPLGVPALTMPFVVVVWAFLLAAPALRRLTLPVRGEDRAVGGP